MFPLDKTPRAYIGNVVFPTYGSGLEGPASLLVFHLNSVYCIMLNCCADGQLFRLRFNLFAFNKAFHATICF